MRFYAERIPAFLVGAALVALILWSLGWLPPKNVNYCYSNESGHEECATYNIALVAFWQIGKGLNWVSPAINAIATVFIAIFTLTLWQSTRRLWVAGEKQIVALQRPWISAQIKITGPLQFTGSAFRLPVNIVLQNTGPSPAIVDEPDVSLRVFKGLTVHEAIQRKFSGPRPLARRYTLFERQELTVSGHAGTDVIEGSVPQFDLLVTVKTI